MSQKFDQFHKAVRFIDNLLNTATKYPYSSTADRKPEMFFKRTQHFLNQIGNPEKGLRYIHITGTAGKGSVSNGIHQALIADGKKAGLFTSPFTASIIEEIKVGEKYIAPDEFADIVDYLKPFIDREHFEGLYGRPSYFELKFIIAIIYFQRQKCEWVVVEVGMGGRFDATNTIPSPVVTAITQIDYDHVQLLGNTLQKIAWNKAGIIKKNSVFFTCEKRKPLLTYFQKVCKEVGVQYNVLPRQENYQKENEALIEAITRHIGIPKEKIKLGIAHNKLPCRFEIIQNKPLVIVDGAHNRAKMRSTAENLQKVVQGRLFLIVAIADNKDSEQILKEIIPFADHVFFTRFTISERKSADPKVLFEKHTKYLKKGALVDKFLDPEQALEKALKLAKSEDTILVTGSFFLSGQLRQHWISEEAILESRSSFPKK